VEEEGETNRGQRREEGDGDLGGGGNGQWVGAEWGKSDHAEPTRQANLVWVERGWRWNRSQARPVGGTQEAGSTTGSGLQHAAGAD
jgi:hypothetical protein